MILRRWAALLRRTARRRSRGSSPHDSLNLQLDLHAATLRQTASCLDRMTANVSAGVPSPLLTSAAAINAVGEYEEHAGHFTLERAAENLENTAHYLRRAAAVERKVLDERGRDALQDHMDGPAPSDEVV